MFSAGTYFPFLLIRERVRHVCREARADRLLEEKRRDWEWEEKRAHERRARKRRKHKYVTVVVTVAPLFESE